MDATAWGRLADLLTAVVEGRVDAFDAIRSPLWEQVGPESADANHELCHYAADADTRSWDADYATWQQTTLREYAAEFRKRGSR